MHMVTPAEKSLLRTMEMMNENISGWKWLARLLGLANIAQVLFLIAVTR